MQHQRCLGFKALPSVEKTPLFFLKLTPMVRLGNHTYRAWGSKIGLKNQELNGSGY